MIWFLSWKKAHSTPFFQTWQINQFDVWKYAHIVSLRSTICMASSHQYVWSISCWWIWQLRWFGQKPGPGTFYISRFLSPLLEISSSNYLVSNAVEIHKYMINLKSKNDTGIPSGCHLRKTPLVASIDIKFPAHQNLGQPFCWTWFARNNNEYKWSISCCWCPEFHLTTPRQVSNSTY